MCRASRSESPNRDLPATATAAASRALAATGRTVFARGAFRARGAVATAIAPAVPAAVATTVTATTARRAASVVTTRATVAATATATTAAGARAASTTAAAAAATRDHAGLTAAAGVVVGEAD